MNISEYFPYFHDGSLIDIQYQNHEIILSITSAEMDRTDMKDNIPLSERGTISGKLHLEEPKSITINNTLINGIFKMPYDYGSIFDFKIKQNTVELQVSWRNAPKKPLVNDFSTIIIQANKIWWENIPDLFDPFW